MHHSGKIRPETLKKTANYLNSVRNHLSLNNYILTTDENHKLCAEYSQSYDILGKAIELGYFKKLPEKNKFSFQTIVFEPIHARKVLERKYAKVNELKRLKRAKEIKNPNEDPNKDTIIIGTIGTKKKTKIPLKLINDHTTAFVIETNVKPKIELKPIEIPEALKKNEDYGLDIHNQLKPTKKKSKKAGTRIFSLFWGLIKITY
jgi:hypothetical protein